MSPIDYLPAEIIEYIIDMLRDDPPALAACSLVCHDWTTRAQCNLFVGLTLDLKAKSQSLKDSDTIASFQSSLNSLPLFTIQRLKIVGGKVPPAIFLWPCWSRLENVTRLYLYAFDFLDFDLPPFVNQFSSLECLSIHEVTSLSVASLFRILKTAQKLSDLRLNHVSWIGSDSTGEDNPHLPHPSIPLRHITLHAIERLDQVVKILVEKYSDLALQSLWTHNVDSDRILMNKYCASLRTLDLRQHNVGLFDMSEYESLHTLVLPKAKYGSIRDGFLSSITSTSFTNIVLFLNHSNPATLVSSNREKFDWARIDEDMTTFHPSVNVIVSTRGLNAKELEAKVSRLGETQSHIVKELATYLPLCVERGVVSFYPRDVPMRNKLEVYFGRS